MYQNNTQSGVFYHLSCHTCHILDQEERFSHISKESLFKNHLHLCKKEKKTIYAPNSLRSNQISTEKDFAKLWPMKARSYSKYKTKAEKKWLNKNNNN